MVDVEEIKARLQKYFTILGDVIIHPDGVVDVKGQVFLKKKVKQLPVQFGDVSDAFSCHERSLTTLIGSPRRVGGGFTCWLNALTTLQGAPDYVGDNFSCGGNKLESLLGAPAHVGGSFYGGGDGGELLTSLEGSPTYVGGIFSWRNCPNLTSLEGAPEQVGQEFICTYYPHLPLLRTIMYPHVQLLGGGYKVNYIINKYAGTKNPADILRCASELNEAGFEGNAEW
jgi:hypothetical protein